MRTLMIRGAGDEGMRVRFGEAHGWLFLVVAKPRSASLWEPLQHNTANTFEIAV